MKSKAGGVKVSSPPEQRGEGQEGPLSPQSFLSMSPFFEEPFKCALFKTNNEKCTRKSIFYMSKLKKYKTLLLIGFYLVENTKSEILFNGIKDALGQIDD